MVLIQYSTRSKWDVRSASSVGGIKIPSCEKNYLVPSASPSKSADPPYSLLD